MDGLALSLLPAAAAIGMIHALLGPDHYLPFVMLARARGWSPGRAAWVTALCGAGHVLSSLLLGGLGLALGLAASRLEGLERARGGIAAWALVAFGLAYAAWGARRALRRSRGLEPHAHGGHVHLHPGSREAHRHDDGALGSAAGFWVLFAIFVLGPCEPLIPLFLLPASRGRWDLALAAAAVFGVLTVATMVGLTWFGLAGARRVRFGVMERWGDAIAGGVIASSGAAVAALGV
jgi:hypothetical protein